MALTKRMEGYLQRVRDYWGDPQGEGEVQEQNICYFQSLYFLFPSACENLQLSARPEIKNPLASARGCFVLAESEGFPDAFLNVWFISEYTDWICLLSPDGDNGDKLETEIHSEFTIDLRAYVAMKPFP